MSIHRRLALLEQYAAWLGGIDPLALVSVERNRLLLRRASALTHVAVARRDDDARSPAAAAFAVWTQAIPAELTEDDGPAVRE